MRKHLMATVILCEVCKRNGRTAVGHVADHVIPLAKGGTGDRSNYQLLCKPCAAVKDARDRGVTLRPRRTFAADGWPIEEIS